MGKMLVNLKIPKGVLRKTYLMQVIMICFAIIVATSLSYMYSVRQLQKSLENANIALVGQIQSNVDTQLYKIDRQAINFMDESNVAYMRGHEGETFRPEEGVTRAEFAAMIVKFTKVSAKESDTTFTDISGHRAADQIDACCRAGYIKGYEDNTFRPEHFITRAEVVTMMNRILKRDDVKDVANPFSDVAQNHWAFADIMEAAVTHNTEN